MALVINKVEEYRYIPVSEREDKTPFTVIFKRLDVRALANLEDGFVNLKGENNISLQQGSYNYKAVKNALIGWENLIVDGEEYTIKFNKRGEVLDECLDMLPSSIFNEIATTIIAVSKDPARADEFLGNDEE